MVFKLRIKLTFFSDGRDLNASLCSGRPLNQLR